MNKNYYKPIMIADEQFLKVLNDDIKKKFVLLNTAETYTEDISVSRHADIQIFCYNDNSICVPKKLYPHYSVLEKLGINIEVGDEEPKGKYPSDCLYNGAVINKDIIIYKEHASVIDKIAKKNNYNMLFVKQGYVKCNLVVFSKYFITSDKGIYNKLTEKKYEGLLIEEGFINLNGHKHGFIGGCSGIFKDTIYFTGKLNTHIDGNRIKEFIKSKNYNIVELTNGLLTDVGSIIILKYL